MKTGLTSSVLLHAALLGFGLVTLSAPAPLEVGDMESLPIDIIPVESLTQLQQGDKTSQVKADKPAPKPTTRQDPVPEARNVGENAIDLEDVPKPEPSPRKVDTASAPKPPEPAPRPEPKPEPVQEAQPEPTPRPEPEPVKETPPEPQPDPVAEAIAANDTPSEALDFPSELPRPQSRPEPERQVARLEEKTPEKPVTPRQTDPKPVEQKAEKSSTSSRQEDLDSLLDQTKALLNREKPAGGGARRSQQQAAIGSERRSTGQALSVSEMDALRQRLGQCWSIPAGVDDANLLKVSVRFRLDRSGELEARPEVIRGGGSSGPARTAAESAVRAVAKCAPFNLPADKYETWAEVVVNFDPSDMF